MSSELAVVMPVYNEAGSIAKVVREWHQALGALGIDFELHAYDDGSRDDTAKILGELARRWPRLCVHGQENRGHGPTILAGYRENAAATWVFQVDSDDEMGPDSFAALWGRRHDFDLLVGSRQREAQPAPRRLLSAASRLVLRVLFGDRVRDANSPYRLMRSEVFRPIWASLEDDTFAPNVILSGCASIHDLRTLELPVPQRARRTGEVSLGSWKLVPVALHAGLQTLRYRLRVRS